MRPSPGECVMGGGTKGTGEGVKTPAVGPADPLGADARERRRDADRAARAVLPGVPGTVLRDHAVVRGGRGNSAGPGGGRCSGLAEDPDRGGGRLVVLRLPERGGHAPIAAVERARRGGRVDTPAG